jgi:hypothetical protein
LKSEKAEVLASIKIQSSKVQMCMEKLRDVPVGASGMTKAFQTIGITLPNVKGATKTGISQMVGSEGVSRMDKL